MRPGSAEHIYEPALVFSAREGEYKTRRLHFRPAKGSAPTAGNPPDAPQLQGILPAPTRIIVDWLQEAPMARRVDNMVSSSGCANGTHKRLLQDSSCYAQEHAKKKFRICTRTEYTFAPYHVATGGESMGKRRSGAMPFQGATIGAPTIRNHGCPASKHVEQRNSEDPPLFRVIYTNEHTCDSAAASDYMASSTHIQQIADASLRKVEMERPPRLQAQCSGTGYTTVIKEEKDAIVSSLTVITGCDVAKSDSVNQHNAALLASNCYTLSPTVARSSHEGSSSLISPVVLPASDDLKMDFMMESLESHWFEPLDLGWFKESTHTAS